MTASIGNFVTVVFICQHKLLRRYEELNSPQRHVYCSPLLAMDKVGDYDHSLEGQVVCWWWGDLDDFDQESTVLTKPRLAGKDKMLQWKLTNRFKSSLLTSGLTPTTFRNIRAIKSSRNITISWSKNLIRHGFVPKCALGTFVFNLPTRVDNKGLRGNVVFIVISKGPGTNKKWVDREISGYAAIKSARASKFSGIGFNSCKLLNNTGLTCISLNVPPISMCNWFTREIATHDDDFRDKIIFDAVVEHLLYSRQCLRIV